ncbi:hypothetical protein [Streptomyces sp. NPDC002769]|uniref:hypothetical protein n=1 Tax=Streptomyces sp. NPDC002769 TaxID=3154542 RepID=UPI0033325B0F
MRQRCDGTTAGKLRGAGLRMAAARVARLAVVRERDHLGIGAATSGARDRADRISPRAVGGDLPTLGATGPVRRTRPARTPAPRANPYDDHGLPPDEAWGRAPGPLPRLFPHPQYLSTTIRLVRKDSHV